MTDVAGDVTVVRWRRYGKDRLYVKTAEDVQLGWWDLVADVGHSDLPEHAATVTAAADRWKADASVGAVVSSSPAAPATEAHPPDPVPAPEPEPEPEPVALAPEPPAVPAAPHRPWIDLATNDPGAEAREQADARRAAAPVRTFLARAVGAHTDERAWRIGADGEEKVAARLAKVARKDPRWKFLHAIPVGSRGSDIDHLAIGPGGVFTLNAKHHPGAKVWVGGDTLLVNGNRQPYVRNSRHEAARAAKLLSAACGLPVLVEGLVVLVNADDITIKNPPNGVHVMPRMQVGRWLLRHGDILDEQTIDTIFDAARRSTTWRP